MSIQAESIQDPNIAVDCFACRGKGYFILRTNRQKRTIFRADKHTFIPASSAARDERIDCGECNGVGKIETGKIQY